MSVAEEISPGKVVSITIASTNNPPRHHHHSRHTVFAHPNDCFDVLLRYRPARVYVEHRNVNAVVDRPATSYGEYTSYQKFDTLLQSVQTSAAVVSAVLSGVRR